MQISKKGKSGKEMKERSSCYREKGKGRKRGGVCPSSFIGGEEKRKKKKEKGKEGAGIYPPSKRRRGKKGGRGGAAATRAGEKIEVKKEAEKEKEGGDLFRFTGEEGKRALYCSLCWGGEKN